jgi:predicted Zn-dependent protease with MMP-like domain
MDDEVRRYFDQILDEVMAEMPEAVHRLLKEVTMYVDDYPSPEVLRRTHVRHRRDLCGLYTGIPLGHRSVEHSGHLSDAIQIFREGIFESATNRRGHVDEDELRRQIRITVLHELGHHHGMTEAELSELGY